MATTGYYIRAEPVRAADGTLACGKRWALIRQDERYRDDVLADNLSEAEARALYWRKLEELLADADTTQKPLPAIARQLGLAV